MLEFIQEIVNRLNKSQKYKAGFMYGSSVNGLTNNKSDFDIALYTEGERFSFKYVKAPQGNVDIHFIGNSTPEYWLKIFFGEKIMPLFNESFVRELESKVKNSIISKTCEDIAERFYPKQVQLDLKTLLVYYNTKIELKEAPWFSSHLTKRMNNDFFDMLENEYSRVLKSADNNDFCLEFDDILTITPKKKAKPENTSREMINTAFGMLKSGKIRAKFIPSAIKGVLMNKDKHIEIHESSEKIRLEAIL